MPFDPNPGLYSVPRHKRELLRARGLRAYGPQVQGEATPADCSVCEVPVSEKAAPQLASTARTVADSGAAPWGAYKPLGVDPRDFEPPVREQPDLAVETVQSGGGPSPVSADDEVTFLALAKMSPAEYSRVRKAEAKRLGIGVAALDQEVKVRRSARPGNTAEGGQGRTPFLCDPEPWPEAVEGAEVLHELAETFKRHLTLPEGASIVLALWTVFTHAHDAFQVSPLLGITSPEKGCGKSSSLMLLGALVRKPLPTANITAAALFRAVEQYRPTLLADEGDTFLSGKDELRGILNSGWLRSQASTVRTVGDDFEARVFSTWGPKAIALIGRLPDSLADRSIEIRMRRQLPDEEAKTIKLRGDRLDQFESLRRKVWRLANEWAESLKRADPEVPEGFSNRLADNWRPLLSIADLAGMEWPEKAREAACTLSGKRSEESVGAMLLTDLRQLFEDQATDRLASSFIVEELCKLEDRPWPEFSHDKAISKRGLSKILGRFGVRPRTIRTDTLESGFAKGYLREDLEDSFRRFVPDTPSENVTPSQGA